MNIEIDIIKGIPVEQINKFEDKVVYNTAVFTREYVKGRNAYPYRTGELRRQEVASPILGSNQSYSLEAGVSYGKTVYNYTNVKWTNPSTLPQWYYTAFRQKGAVLLTDAVLKAKKEI